MTTKNTFIGGNIDPLCGGNVEVETLIHHVEVMQGSSAVNLVLTMVLIVVTTISNTFLFKSYVCLVVSAKNFSYWVDNVGIFVGVLRHSRNNINRDYKGT